MSTLKSISGFVSLYNEIQELNDKNTAATFLNLSKGNKTGATLLAVGTIGLGIAMNYGIASYLQKKGHKRSSKFVRQVTTVAVAINLPSYKRVIKNIISFE